MLSFFLSCPQGLGEGSASFAALAVSGRGPTFLVSCCFLFLSSVSRCLPAGLLACWSRCLPAGLLACWPAGLDACLLACWPRCLLVVCWFWFRVLPVRFFRSFLSFLAALFFLRWLILLGRFRFSMLPAVFFSSVFFFVCAVPDSQFGYCCAFFRFYVHVCN